MHTDEYEISLYREMTHCAERVRSLRRTLAELEQDHRLDSGPAPDQRQEMIDALAVWEQRRLEYEQLYRLMKI